MVTEFLFFDSFCNFSFDFHMQSPKKLMGQSKVIKQNWKGPKSFDI